MGWAAEDDYDATYGREQAKIRRRLKDELMAEATMGTKAGQWSARKSQELKRRYEAACERAGLKPYKGSKTAKQKDLSDWSDQDWRTSSGGKSSVTGEPYFPAKAVEALKERDLYAKAKRQKAAATRAGKQRATYSKDIQAVVARYRAEDDHTLDDLDDQTIINRMEHIGERMAEIVQKHGGSYQNAERDPEYLRLARDHHALARVFVRRHGNIDMDAEYVEPPMDLEEEAEARLEAIRQLQWGLRVIDRMLTEGNIDEAIAFTRATVDAMDQEEAADRDLGLDPDRFSAEDDASFAPDPDLPLTEQARDQYMFMMSDGSTLWIHNQDWAVGMADMKPTWDPKRLSDYGGTPTTVTYMSLGAVDPADYTDFIPEWRPGMSFPPEDMVDHWIDPSRLGEAHNEFTKQYETSFWPGLSLREILGRHDGGNPVFAEEFDAESDDEDDEEESFKWSNPIHYPSDDPDWLYEQHVVQGLSAQDIARMLDVPIIMVTRRIHQFGLYVGPSGHWVPNSRVSSSPRSKASRIEETRELLCRGYSTKEIAEILGVSDYSVRTYQKEIRSRFDAEDEDLQVCYNCKTTREERSVLPHRLSRGETKTTRKLGLCYDCGGCYDCCELVCEPDDVKADHGFEAESDDPVSRIAAGTNDALADFANAHDTDDGFYFAGGLIGGLAIAVAGNILADRVQEWWKGRSSS